MLLPSADEKVHPIKTISKSIKSIFNKHELKNTMFPVQEDCQIVPIDKAAKHVAFIGKHFYALNISKKN